MDQLKIQDDILISIDDQKCVILLLLDLSAAFDTVDHPTLLNRLKTRFGITGQAYNWIASYFENRKQSVVIGGCKSKEQVLTCKCATSVDSGPQILFGLWITSLHHHQILWPVLTFLCRRHSNLPCLPSRKWVFFNVRIGKMCCWVSSIIHLQSCLVQTSPNWQNKTIPLHRRY